MKKSALTLFIVFSFSLGVFSQTENRKEDCPTVNVIIPPEAVGFGQTIIFTAKISGTPDSDKVEYKWTVDGGKITSGQGTDSISVILDEAETRENETKVVASVYAVTPQSCDLFAFGEGVFCRCGSPDLVDEFDEIPEEDIRARFDNMFIRLQNAPEAKAAVINYGSDKAIQARIELLNNHIKLRGYDKNKIIIKNGGKEETIRTRIWLVPEGIDPDLFN